jgi:hypothetical protein
LKKRRPGAERGSDSRVIDEVSDESLDALTVENEDYGLFRKEDAVSPKARQSKSVRRPLAMISAARSREPGRSVATTATRSFSSPDFALRSRPNTAPRSLRGERWPLSRPVGTGEFYVSFAQRTSVSLRRVVARTRSGRRWSLRSLLRGRHRGRHATSISDLPGTHDPRNHAVSA